MTTLNFLIAFNLGLISTLHCWGMCGPIITAFSLGLPDQNAPLGRIVLFNAGRITSYVIAGLIVGFVGAGLFQLLQAIHGQLVLQLLAAAVLVAIGLHVGGWFPQFRRIETIGQVVWKRLQPLTRQLLPVDNPAKAWTAGLIWGWLPCGLVYSMLLWNLANAQPLTSALNMLGFGLGTLPGMVAAGYMAQKTGEWMKHKQLRQVLGLLVVGAGIISAWVAVQHPMADHSHHQPAAESSSSSPHLHH